MQLAEHVEFRVGDLFDELRLRAVDARRNFFFERAEAVALRHDTELRD